MPNTPGSNRFSTLAGLGRAALLSAAILVAAGLAASATLSANSLASKTVGPGAENVVALNFSFEGDQVLNGTPLSFNQSLNFTQDNEWNISSYESGDEFWNSSHDFLANDTDNDTAYTSQNDTVLAGTLNLVNGDGLVEVNPWGNVTFYDNGDGKYNFSEDAIVNDLDNDTYLTNDTADSVLNGTSLNEGAELLTVKPANWTNVSFYDHQGGASWTATDDTIVLENSTDNSFAGEFNGLGDVVIAGNSSIFNGTNLSSDRPSDWTEIKFYNGTVVGWNTSHDAMVHDTAGNGTYSTRNDLTINGTNLTDGVDLSENNLFTGNPGLAFNDSEPDGNWTSGDVILRDYGSLTVSTDNDSYIAGTAPDEGTSYTNASEFYFNWTLYSVDNSSSTSLFNPDKDAIVYDDDNNSVFGHQLNALTVDNSSTATADDITGLDLWAENNSDYKFSKSGDAHLGNMSYESGRWVLDDLTWNFTSSEPFYVTANISNDPVNMPELQLEVPKLNDVDGNGTLNDTADSGFFVNGSSDTGGVTGTKHTIYTANITEVETRSSVDDANPENAEEVVIRFSEYVNVSGVAFNDDINFTNPEVTTPNPNTPLTNVTEMVVGIDSLGGNKVTGIEYMGTGIKTYERGFELSHDNSSVDIIDGVNNAPNADAGGDRSVDEGGSLTLDCDSSTDPEGDNLDCRWKITGDPTNGATIEGESQGTWVSGSSVDFEAPTVDGDATVEVTLQVNDTGGLTDVSVFDVLVTNTQTTQTTQTSGGGGGSGQGSGSGSKQDDQKAQEPTKISRSVIIGRGKSEKLDIGAETVGSMRIEAASSSEVIGSLEYEEKSSRPSSVESDPEGKAYKYIRIEKNNFDNRQVESVEFRFKVSKGWINSNNIAPKTVKLQRYNSGWLQLDTRVRSEDAGNYYYTATSPGFSVFSVTGTSYSDLFKVQEIKVDSKSIQKGGNVTISVTVHNGAQSRASYNLEVKAGGKTLSRDIEVDGGANRTVTFTRSFSEAGTKTVSAGGKSVEVQVKSKGLPWMIIGAAVLGLLGLGATYLFWPEIKGELGWVEAELGGFTDKLSGLEEVPKMVGKLGAIPRVIGEIGSSKGGKRSYSFEGFGEDEDFDYSFDE